MDDNRGGGHATLSSGKRVTISRRLEDPNGILSRVKDIGDSDNDDVEMDDDELQETIEQFQASDADMSFIVDLIQSKYQSKALPTSFTNSPAQFIQTFSDLNFTLRAEEEQHLRQPFPDEKECASGLECEARNIYSSWGRVTLVEHLTAQERLNPSERAGLCIMCKRSKILYAIINCMCEDTDMSKLFHSHCNYVNTVGEYALDQCMTAGRTETHGVFAPIVAHCRFYYEAYYDNKHGIVRFAQTGYKSVFQ